MTTDKWTSEEAVEDLRNEDPLSGEAGDHPGGAGVGSALGGGIAGAAAGVIGGPIGAVAGAVVGGVAGGLAGKAAVESIDPTVEVAYWRDAHAGRPYIKDDYTFYDDEPAYRAGVDTYDLGEPTDWEERQEAARIRWEDDYTEGRLTWDDARPAAEDAYRRIHTRQSSRKAKSEKARANQLRHSTLRSSGTRQEFRRAP